MIESGNFKEVYSYIQAVTETIKDGQVYRKPAGLALSVSEIEVGFHDSITSPTLTKATDSAITWSSSDEEVVTVTNNGELAIVGIGEAVVTASAEETPAYEAGSVSCSVTIGKSDPSLELTAEAESVAAGSDLATSLSKHQYFTGAVTYASSNEEIATVSDAGVISGVAAGTVTISVASEATTDWIAGSDTLEITVTAAQTEEEAQ